MTWSFQSFWARYRPWDKAVDPRDETKTPAELRRHFALQHSEQIVLQQGVNTPFGQLLMRSMIDNLHDMEVKQVWAVTDFNEFIRLRERRAVLFELLNMIGSSEQRMREIERINEGLPPDND